MRLTTREEHPHGAEGRAEEKLTGKWCRGTFEATAIVERLAAYENLEEDGLLYVIGDVIHPKIISRVLGVELETAVRILDDLSKKDIFDKSYNIIVLVVMIWSDLYMIQSIIFQNHTAAQSAVI